MGKSTSYENKQTKLMATVAVHQTRWQLFVCHKENFPLCFALTRPCLMWLISHQMKITHLLTVATAFETMLLFSGNVKDLKKLLTGNEDPVYIRDILYKNCKRNHTA